MHIIIQDSIIGATLGTAMDTLRQNGDHLLQGQYGQNLVLAELHSFPAMLLTNLLV